MMSGFAQVQYIIIIHMSVSERIIFIIVVTVVVPRVCVCVPSLFVVFCRHVYVDSDVRLHRCTENSYIIYY